eukprot:CAMPEP_0194682396 /NCGR_PEP_ID=MMETSP0295-20121207/12738_1 /TAXON_ID=39354 /ORGANISM="Heterosigma akashiwo, Strain CCMP2393" /LENGTH=198 /DNA_ID=CAMNT_0039568733 /DNA_START=15 /DNA_END=608 /DNA_ORIENTATION=+
MGSVERLKIAEFGPDDGSASFNEEGLEFIRRVPGPIVLVCCTGSQAPSGIDTLLNTTNSCQGLKSNSLYIFSQPLSIMETGAVFLIHTPGFLSGSEHNPPNPPAAAAVALVIASSILHFSGTNTDCAEFHKIEEIVPMIQIQEGQEADWSAIASRLPPLLWAAPEQALADGSKSGKKFMEAAFAPQGGFEAAGAEADR